MTEKNTASITAGDFEKSAIRKMSIVGIVGNILLSAFKLFAGIAGHSGAMLSDAIHSMSDIFATVIALIGVKLAKNSNDDSHQYGHERFECIASMILGVILLSVGLAIGKSGIETIISGNFESITTPGTIALIAAAISIVTKEAMYWYTRHYAKLLNSTAFMADAWHHRSDAFSSIGSLAGIAGSRLGFPILDSVASVVICIFILKVAISVIIDSFKKVLDTSLGKEYEEKIRSFIQDDPDVKSIDLLHTRMFGNKAYVDLEISLDGTRSLNDTHAIAENIHDKLESNFPEVKHVMIHVNPA